MQKKVHKKKETYKNTLNPQSLELLDPDVSFVLPPVYVLVVFFQPVKNMLQSRDYTHFYPEH